MRSRCACVSSMDERWRRASRSDASLIVSCHSSGTGLLLRHASVHLFQSRMWLFVLQHGAHTDVPVLVRWGLLHEHLGMGKCLHLIVAHDVLEWQDMGGGGYLAGIRLAGHIYVLENPHPPLPPGLALLLSQCQP